MVSRWKSPGIEAMVIRSRLFTLQGKKGRSLTLNMMKPREEVSHPPLILPWAHLQSPYPPLWLTAPPKPLLPLASVLHPGRICQNHSGWVPHRHWMWAPASQAWCGRGPGLGDTRESPIDSWAILAGLSRLTVSLSAPWGDSRGWVPGKGVSGNPLPVSGMWAAHVWSCLYSIARCWRISASPEQLTHQTWSTAGKLSLNGPCRSEHPPPRSPHPQTWNWWEHLRDLLPGRGKVSSVS